MDDVIKNIHMGTLQLNNVHLYRVEGGNRATFTHAQQLFSYSYLARAS